MKIKLFINFKNKKRGSTLIFAIFLLLVFSFIGFSLVSMLSGQNISSSEELHSIKAFFLAESGLEIAMVRKQGGVYKIDNSTIDVEYNVMEDNNSYLPSKLVTIKSIGNSFEMKRKIEAKFRVFE
ncbi:pilus assembly PilX N-terminal domain-containing protein [Calditerrivibrio sp.]|jgi:MSHA biogenesis protein MshP|uniref:pilus assembly PilX N-terminal domain-containing protein n=1 Tax=Calditerrivibrio sp. TaxID=2792612 RepID=UPI003D0D57F8